MTGVESLISYVLIPLGGYIAFEDYRSRTIPLWAAIIFMVALFPLMNLSQSLWSLGFLMLLLFPLYRQWIAPVDVLLLVVSPLVLPLPKLPIFLIGTGLGVILFQKITGEKRIPFLTVCVPILLILLFLF